MAVVYSQNGVIVKPTGFDVIGGKKYKTVQMPDGKIWLAENLDFKFCNIGGPYSTASTTPEGWYINNDESTYGWNGYKCGLLYNWYSVKLLNDHRSDICPGWHVPTTAEWDALASAIGVSTAGTKLKAVDGSAGTSWPTGWNGTDDYGFKALPAGGYGGSFDFVGSTAIFWTTSSTDIRFIEASGTTLDSYGSAAAWLAYSLRLVRDAS